MITKVTLTSLLLAQPIPKLDVPILVCIAEKESQFDSKVINHTNSNGTKDYGLFQINDINKKLCKITAKKLLNVYSNIKCAVKVYKYQGLIAWTTFRLCRKKDEIRYVSNRQENKTNFSIISQQQIETSPGRRRRRDFPG